MILLFTKILRNKTIFFVNKMGYAVVMRHGNRKIWYDTFDNSLTNFDINNMSNCCPELNNTVEDIKDLNFYEIIASPYLRTRQTALVVQHLYFEYTGKILPIRLDDRLGEYVPKITCFFKNPKIEDFDNGTIQGYNGKQPPYCNETKEECESRVREFYYTLKPNTLVITHQYIVKYLCNLNGQFKNLKLKMGDYNILNF